MSEPIAPQFISRRRLLWLAALAAAAPATLLSTPGTFAQQNDQAPSAAPAAPKAAEKKKKKKKDAGTPAGAPPAAPKQQ
jgi:hypothetical protein